MHMRFIFILFYKFLVKFCFVFPPNSLRLLFKTKADLLPLADVCRRLSAENRNRLKKE